MKFIRGTRSSLALALLVLAAGMAIAACGGSGSSGSSASAAVGTATTGGTGTSGAAGTPGGRARFALTATQRSCLQKHGVTLPNRRPGTGTHTFTRPANGTSTRPGFGGGAFFGGGRRPGGANASKYAAAFKACGVNFGGGRFGPGASAARPSSAAIAKFSACVKQHGYSLPKANLSGSGPVFPANIANNAKFQKAARSCISDLRGPYRPAGAGNGAPPPPTGAPAPSNS